jgi:hypothetical protein
MTQNHSGRMRRLLASDLLPQRAELRDRDQDGILQDQWIAEYRARWAAHRAANSVSTGDGGAWLDGDAAREVVCDAMVIPVVTGDIDPGAVEDLVDLCVRFHQLRTQAGPGPVPAAAAVPAGLAGAAARRAGQAAAAAAALAELEQQILGTILQVVSGPGGAASFLRRQLLGKPLAGPSLPLDVGQTDDIPLHLRRLVALRDQRCQYPGGCDQPASGCEPHHVRHRSDGGRTSLTNLKDYCSLMAPPRGSAPAGLDPDCLSRRHQPGTEPRRQDHPQPQPPTATRVTTPARRRARSSGGTVSEPERIFVLAQGAGGSETICRSTRSSAPSWTPSRASD